MFAFGPGTKTTTGWYVRVWPNPGLAFPYKGGRAYVRLFTTKPGPNAKRIGLRRGR